MIILIFFLFYNNFLSSATINGKLSDYFESECSAKYYYSNQQEITTLLNYFIPLQCNEIVKKINLYYFEEIINCCEELSVCYQRCETEKLFCDNHFKKCLENHCSENFKNLGDYYNYENCNFLKDFHYSYKKNYGCEYFYYNKIRNNCF